MRKLQIIMGEFNGFFKWGLWGLQIVLIIAVTFGICGAVWAEGPLKIHLAGTTVGSTFIFSLTYSNLASIFDVSSEVLGGWRQSRAKQAWTLRFLRSTPPIRVLIGIYFYAHRELVLTSLGIVAQNSVTLLVTHRG